MSFSVRRVEDPTIYVRRNKSDILGIGSVWDNIGNFKDDLDRLEDNIDAADKPMHQKPGKKASSLTGPILKEISSETQHLGKVTRFQLLGENCSYKSLPRSAPSVEIKTRRNDGNKAIPFSDISSINRETYSKSSQALSGVSDRNGYFPSRYTVNGSKSEQASFFMTTTVNPVVINDTSSDLNQNKESSFANTTVNSSLNSQQFSLSTPPSFHGKAVLAKNGAALEKIKERVHKQKTMLSKKDKEISSTTTVDRRLHDCKDKVAISSEKVEKKDALEVPLKRKVGAISSSGPTYRGFNPVLSHRSKKKEKSKSLQGTNKTSSKGSAKPLTKPEPRVKKVPARMTRIVSSKCPKEFISTTSWRDGRATVKKILGAKKVKPSSAPVGGPKKADTTYNVASPTQDEVSEGKLSSDENEDFEVILPAPRAKKPETEGDVPKLDGIEKASDTNSSNSDAENDEKLRDVLSTEAQSMLAELAEDNSDIELESEMKEEKSKKQGGTIERTSRRRKSKTTSKPAVDEKYPKEKSRHYDQTEVQKYMAQQVAERKNRLKQEKLQKKKQEEERQRRLNHLYERQKKSFAMSKKEKLVGQAFSCDDGAVRIPGHESYSMEYASGQNESDKENTDVADVQRSSNGTSLDNYSDSDEVNDIDSHEHLHMHKGGHLNGDESPVRSAMTINHPLGQGTVPLDIRAHRLCALQSTALALQSRLQSQAFRLGGVDEESVSQPPARVSREEEETEFKGILPGVANIRKQADENEKQFVKVEAATKIQAAYRAHNVRKTSQWTDENSPVSSHHEHSDDDDVMIDDINERHDVASTAGNVEYPHSPYEVDRSNNGFKLNDLRFERSRVLHADVPILPSTHFSVPSVQFEPRGDRFSVMNVFSRRHPTVTVEEILNEQPGSETASLLDVEVKTDPKEEYEDDFTDEDISTTSAITEGDLRKESSVVSTAETYSECFESEEEHEKDRTMLDVEDKKSAQHDSSHSPTFNGVVSPKADSVIMPVMTSTMHPDAQHHSFSLSDDSESVHRPVFIKPAQHTTGNRMSPGSLQRKLTAEINRLETVEDSVRQVADIDKARAVSLAQQETVSFAQFLKAQQQNHEQQIQSLRLKAKDEAIQAAKDLEKTSHAAAMAAAHAKETLAEVQNEALKTNAVHSKRYVEEVSQMATSVLSDTTKQLAEFCKNVTATTSNTVEQLHKIDQPTTTLVERATSISEGHWIQLENECDEHTRTSDVYSNQSKSRDASLSVTSDLQQGYSSDDFVSDKSRTNTKEESEMKTEQTASVSFSVGSIPEDLADKSAADDDTTINEESPNDSQSLSTEKQKGGSPLLDYSSQCDDSSHVPTDDEIYCLLPSIGHKKKSIKRITDDSFDEEKGKGKNTRTPFESDDLFGKFTVEIIQQYMKEEEVRTKHQSAILRLKEKSLKEKTKADLQWLEQLKRHSQNKGSDDVMPSIKKRKRGIMMKLEVEKEEIKCLKAANRAASFQRRFMIYQQREITRLHQATLNIRAKIQRDVSKKSSQKSLHEPSAAQPKTSSPIRAETNSSMRTSPSNSLSEVKKSSISANSVSEDISEEQGTSHASPTATASPFPSYSATKSERSSQGAESAQPPSERETSSVHRMLRFVGSGEPELSDENLLKIKKMLLKKHQKLVEDESEVNIMLRKVTEMINNQKNNMPIAVSHENTPAELVRTPSTISDVNDGEEAKNHSELSIPEDLASTGETISDEIEKDISKKTANTAMKDISEKTPSEYTNCTFESDDTTPSKPPTLAQTSTLNTEAHVEDDHSSLTETSDHSDYEEKIKKLKEEIQSEEVKADALEKKKRKMKRSAMKKEVLTLETELKNKQEDNQRKMVEIRTASTLPLPVVNPPISRSSSSSIKSNVSQNSAKETSLLSEQKMYHSVSAKEAFPVSESQRKKRFENSDHEIEESLIEILDGPTTSFRDTMRSGPASLERSEEGSDIPEEISEHLKSEAHSIASIPEETNNLEEEQNVASNASDISQKSYTEPESSPSIPEDFPDGNLRHSLDKTPEIAEEVLDDNSYTEPQSNSSISEDLKDSPETTPGVPEEVLDYSYTKLGSSPSIVEQSPGITEDVKESHGNTASVSVEEYSYTEPRSSTNISDGSPTSHEKLKQSEDLSEAIPEEESDVSLDETSVQEELDNRNSDTSETLSEVAEDEDHISEKDNVLPEKSHQDLPNLNDSENLAEKSAEDFDGQSQISEISEKEQDEDYISENDNVSAEKVLKDSPNVEDSENLAEMSAEDLDVRSQVSDNSDISEIWPEVAKDDISEKSNLSTERTPEVFPNLKDPEFSSKIVPKDSDEIQDVTVASSHDIDTSEKSTPVVPETSIKIAGKEDISEKPSVLVDHEHLETNDAKEDDDKSRSQTSSIAEEIASAYDDEDFSEFGSLKEEESDILIVEKADSGEKQSFEWDESDESAHTSAGNEEFIPTGSRTVVPNLPMGEQDEQEVSENSEKLDSIDKNESVRSESSKSEKLKAVETEKVEPASQEEEQEYSEDFEADDDEQTESDIPEILEEEGEELDDENFKTFTADNKVVLAEKEDIEDGDKASDQDEVLDDITDEIYREIMDDSFDCIKTTKNSRRKVEQKEEVGKDKDKSTVDTDDITKDLLADAFLQMMSVKRRKNEKQEDSKLAGKRHHLNTVAKPSGKSPGYETPAVTNPLGLGAGLGAMDEQKVNNALMIAESNQKEALKAMNQDIEGLLGTSLDDDEDDFPVNENKFPDHVSDDTEPSVHDYSPMFAVPHNAQEVTSIVNSTIDILTAKKQEGLPLDDCKPTAHILGEETESEFENRSTRSYRNLVFDLTKEVYIDAVLQNEVASQPPWAKAKWKGGQKLSRNFMRWKSDDEVRALVLERVTHTIGLGAPRTTMQTLQRKTPVRGNKKDNVDAILIEELRQEEPQWTDYDEDEAAVKFQVADSILNMLLDDTVRVFNAIQAKKKVPDDVVVI